ncbi:hypothetical protein [Streptosporangium sp. NBC_01469]|uniref:hypothetical protein n=1 Tax=Streptosporangium sp. NBC_01469 TaxID=2903898 RepID=UPI002E2B7F3C|nr:hypothetical protein [Streptosporangium sp. NBC_01469]
MVVSDDSKSSPDPEQAGTWPEFTEKLRELHVWCGKPKYATLSKTSGLAPSAISNLIGKNPLGRPPQAAALRLVEACLIHGGSTPAAVQEQSRRWQDAWKALAAEEQEQEPGTAPAVAETRRRRPWIAITVAVVVVAGVGAGAWALSRSSDEPPPAPTPTAAQDAEGCVDKDLSIKDDRTKQTWQGLFECSNTPGSDVYERAGAGEAIGRLESNPSWFVCWTRGERHRGGNDVWYYTQGDYALAKKELKAWGFIPAVNVHTETDPDPNITRECAFD